MPWNLHFFMCKSTVFRRVFFLQLQCKKFNAYNITDHLIFCCCRNPGRKNLSRENIWQKQNQSTLPIILGRKHFPTVSSWIKCFYKKFDKKSRKNNLGKEKSNENQTWSAICNRITKKKSDIKNSSVSNPVKHELTGRNYHHFSL